jgi:hypothetical protein
MLTRGVPLLLTKRVLAVLAQRHGGGAVDNRFKVAVAITVCALVAATRRTPSSESIEKVC